jgi:outer membrane biosynthesis protein TonB
MTQGMRTVLATVLVTGCWSSATKEPAPPAAPPPAPAPAPTPAPAQPETALPQGDALGSTSKTDDTDIHGGPTGNEPDSSGVGTGSGSGGGGTGWGTIGTGRYGKIGHDSGTGNGYGVSGDRGGMRSGASQVPTVSIGQPNATPSDALDKAIIRRYIKRNIQKITYCYERVLADKPALSGTLTTKFTINADGRVTSSAASGLDPKVESCVAQTVQAIEFPKPKDSKTVDVVYPFTFRPSGS